MQDVPLKVATIYRGNEPLEQVPVSYNFGLFDTTGAPRRMALAMDLWGRMGLFPERVGINITRVDGDEIEGVWAIAGENTYSQTAILIANSTSNEIVIEHLPQCFMKEGNQYTPFTVSDISPEMQVEGRSDGSASLIIPQYSVVFAAPE